MDVEELLRTSARRIATDLTPPPLPDPTALGAHAEVLRRRRRAGATVTAAAAAVLAAAVLVPATSDRESGGEPADRPTPAPLGDVPAWVDEEGDIHVGNHELDLPGRYAGDTPLAPRGTTRFSVTRTGVVWREQEMGPEESAGEWVGSALTWQSPGGEPVELPADEPQFFTADPLGDLVVWATAEDEMVTYDVAERTVVDSRRVPGIVGDDPRYVGTTLPVLFVSKDVVVYETGEHVETLHLADGTTTQLPGVSATDVLDVHPDVTVIGEPVEAGPHVGKSSGLGMLEFRTAAGTVQAGSEPLFLEGRLSPDGRWFITSTGYDTGLRTVVLDTVTGKQIPLDLPDFFRGPYSDPWGWTGSNVLHLGLLRPIDKEESREEAWTCRPAAGSCRLLEGATTSYPW